MKKLSSTLVAATASAGMLIGAGIATAQVPAPVPSECPAGQHFENVGGTFKCVEPGGAPNLKSHRTMASRRQLTIPQRARMAPRVTWARRIQ